MKKPIKGRQIKLKIKKIGFGTLYWLDASMNTGHSLQSMSKLKDDLVQTFGMIYEDKSFYYVLTHYAGEENNDYMKVPKGMGVEMKLIEDIDEDDFFLEKEDLC